MKTNVNANIEIVVSRYHASEDDAPHGRTALVVSRRGGAGEYLVIVGAKSSQRCQKLQIQESAND